MKKLLFTGLGVAATLGFATPAFADPDIEHDIGAAHGRLHQTGVEWGPGHERWHMRADRVRQLEYMNQQAIREQSYYGGAVGSPYYPAAPMPHVFHPAPVYHAPPVAPVPYYAPPAPAYYGSGARVGFGGVWRFSIGR